MFCRYSALCWLFAAGALVPIASAVLLAREKRLWRHEGLKAKCFILSIIAGMVDISPVIDDSSVCSLPSLVLPADVDIYAVSAIAIHSLACRKTHATCGLQMTAIMLNFEEARRNLALPMHGLLVNGGISPAIFSISALFMPQTHFTRPRPSLCCSPPMGRVGTSRLRASWACQGSCILCLVCCLGTGVHVALEVA